MTAESFDPNESRRQSLMDGSGRSAYVARETYPDTEGEDTSVDVVKQKPSLPGKPLQFPPRGNVRDVHDGGRADEYRGGVQQKEPLTQEEIERKDQGVAAAREAISAMRKQQIIDSIEGPVARTAALERLARDEAIKEQIRKNSHPEAV